MNEKELIEEITRIILTNHYNSSAPHVPKKLAPNEKPPWLTNKNKPALNPEASNQEHSSWTNSDIISLVLQSFFATLCYQIA